MVVEEVDRLSDDPFEEGIVSGRGDGGVKGHVSSGDTMSPGAVKRSESRCRSSIVARRAARLAASISTALRISINSMMRSAPRPSRGARGAAK